jgi:hypothetical protein
MTITSKVIESMKQFAESYAKSTNTYFCSDLEVTESVILGLAKNKESFEMFKAPYVLAMVPSISNWFSSQNLFPEMVAYIAVGGNSNQKRKVSKEIQRI